MIEFFALVGIVVALYALFCLVRLALRLALQVTIAASSLAAKVIRLALRVALRLAAVGILMLFGIPLPVIAIGLLFVAVCARIKRARQS